MAVEITKRTVVFFIAVFVCSPVSAQVRINEFFPNAQGSDVGYEWVEIFNSGNSVTDIGHWTIDVASSISNWSTTFVFPSPTFINPGDFLVVGGQFVAGADFQLSPGQSLGLGNAGDSGDAVRLVGNDNGIIDTVIYGPNNNDGFLDDGGEVASSLALIGEAGESISRRVDGVDTNESGVDFIVTQPTLGKTNVTEGPIFGDGFEQPLIPVCDDLSPMVCDGSEAYCGELLPFEPTEGPGYDNYPINGETADNQYRSYVRRDLMMLIKYATEKVACVTTDWTPGNVGPLGLGDMSESDGAIPGTSIGQLGHPAGTHTDGHDIDVAYYQTGTVDNRLRAVCTVDDQHCSAPPHLMDANRTTLFLGYVSKHPGIRVIGVDGQAGLIIDGAALSLCSDGSLSPAECERLAQVLAYEVTDESRGWFRFLYHRIHISINPGT